ncbi:MupG family TIM beta-alpha barrel fold protein [Anaerococcus sp.]|uniref:MupG family TIM beta-alpha barrel fold protein n=1 Tax=Anaerococcus sp. TaxID=1872515 RepID=UPI0027BB0039|nr:MupG family TIM beta-alpha barrel fold protein [Anaerococcus sp.]
MKHTLGISVYPDVSPLEDIKKYIELSSKYGFKKIFSSMFSVEGSKEEVLDYFEELIAFSHKHGMIVDLDVNPDLFKRLDASINDLSVFSEIGVDILRMDQSFGKDKDFELMNNKYGIDIEFNSNIKVVDGLAKAGANPEDILVCYNFYPQRYTGFGWDVFREMSSELKSYGDVNIGAFVSSNNSNTHGVWDSKDGLPTVESLRYFPIDTQARILLATGLINDIIIGNAYASEDELKSLKEVYDNHSFDICNEGLKESIESGTFTVNSSQVIQLKPELCEKVSDVEKDILYNFAPHISIERNNEFIWRSRMSRIKDERSIEPRTSDKKYFDRGDVLIVNDNYRHYAGEVEIALGKVENDGERNLVARIKEDELMMLDLIDSGILVKFIK